MRGRGKVGNSKLEMASQKRNWTRIEGIWADYQYIEEPVTKDETRKALEQATIVLKWVEDTIE